MLRRDSIYRRDETHYVDVARRDAAAATTARPRTTRARRRRAAVCLLSVTLMLSTACGKKAITSVPTESDAIELLDVLGQGGLNAEKRETGEGETKRWEIVVDEGWFGGGEASLAVQVLRDHGLPRPEEPVGDEGGLIPSERTEKQREQRRIRGDIERQLRALPGVTLAIVTVVMPQDPTLELNPYPATASVVINHKDAKPLFTEQQVQNLVAGGVPNLKAQDVRVTISPQTLRPVPQGELNARRRNNILLAVGVGVVTVLGFLLVVLLLQTRRQRAQLSELREGGEPPADDDEDEDGDAAALNETGLKQLNDPTSNGAAAR